MRTLQFKLAAALTALIVFVSLLSGVLIERNLRARETAQIERSLGERVALVQQLVEGISFENGSLPELDAIAESAADAAAARVTLVSPSGRVVGDSDVPFPRLGAIVNHGDRPEIRAALAGGVGQDARHSDTVGRRLFYVAASLPNGGGVVRLAADLSDLDNAVRDLRLGLVLATVAGLIAAIALSFVLSWWALRPLNEMRRVVGSMAQGHLETKLPARMTNELGDIADAINRMAEQLRERLAEATVEKERIHAVLNSMVEGVFVVDADGELLLVNERFRELVDLQGEFRGRAPLEVIRNADFDQLLRQAAQTNEPVFSEIETAGPSPRYLQVHGVRFPPGDGPRMGTVAVLHEITEVRHLEKIRQDFVANASHELRTPLAAVRGFAETLLRGAELSEEDRRSYLGIIERHALRLEHIVDDLLALSRAESAAATLQPVAVDLVAIANSLVQDARRRPAAQGLRIELRVTDPVIALADPQAAEQIISNLLDNAVKYTEPGGRIEIDVEVLQDEVRVSVSDTGLGIPDRDLSRIFERFYRVDKARSRELGGTGLGLSIVRHLVQKMGGAVSVQSEVGKGSSFAFTLPRDRRPS